MVLNGKTTNVWHLIKYYQAYKKQNTIQDKVKISITRNILRIVRDIRINYYN